MSDSFIEITPTIAAGNSPEILRDEVLRRMEVHVLGLLHGLLLPPPRALNQNCPRPSSSLSPAAPSHPPPESVAQRSRRCYTPTSKYNTAAAAAVVVVSAPHRSVQQPGIHSVRALQQARHQTLLLHLLYANVQRGVVRTHRDVYYQLVRDVPCQAVVNRTVLQLARVLRVPRERLGVTAGGRGFVGGAIWFHGHSVANSAVVLEGLPLPLLEADLAVQCVDREDDDEDEDGGDDHAEMSGSGGVFDHQSWGSADRDAVSHIGKGKSRQNNPYTIHREGSEQRFVSKVAATGFRVPPNVRFVLVIEKHAMFAQLLREGLPKLLPCVLITAQGFPTHAAHQLLHNLHTALPRAVVVGLADYNPHGLAILSAYRWASTQEAEDDSLRSVPAAGAAASEASCAAPCAAKRRGGAMPENRFCAVQSLRWCALRSSHLEQLRSLSKDNWAGSGRQPTQLLPLQPFTHRDTVVLDNLMDQLKRRLGRACTHGTATANGPPPSKKRRMIVPEGRAQGEPQSQRSTAQAPACHTIGDSPACADEASAAAWLAEAKAMQAAGVKCELEVLYTDPFSALFGGASTAAASHATAMRLSACSHAGSQAAYARCSGGGLYADSRTIGPFAMWLTQQLLKGNYI